MKTILVDSLANILDLTDITDQTKRLYNPKQELPDISTQVKILDRFQMDGGFETGDGTIKSRSMEVTIYIIATNPGNPTILELDKNFRRVYNQVGAFFKPNRRPFYIEDSDNGLRTKVSYGGMKGKWKAGLEMRIAEATLQFNMVDPFFEGVVLNHSESNVATGGTFIVAVNDADLIEVYNGYPIIGVTALGSNPDFTLENLTTGDSIRIQELSFSTGNIITMNSEDGTVKLGTVIKPLMKTDGNFLKLQGGNNTFSYMGASNVDISIDYRRRYLR